MVWLEILFITSGLFYLQHPKRKWGPHNRNHTLNLPPKVIKSSSSRTSTSLNDKKKTIAGFHTQWSNSLTLFPSIFPFLPCHRQWQLHHRALQKSDVMGHVAVMMPWNSEIHAALTERPPAGGFSIPVFQRNGFPIVKNDERPPLDPLDVRALSPCHWYIYLVFINKLCTNIAYAVCTGMQMCS